TSASLMVRWPAAEDAAAYGREHPELSIGLHLDLCEWIYGEDAWSPLYEVVTIDDREAVADEVARQLEMFRRLMGREPTHLDSHQHVHRSEPVHSIMMETLKLLPEGITELGCHPGLADDLNSMYSTERMKEIEVLCDPRIRATIEDERIELCSFHSLAVGSLVT